jgi:phospholipid/cholesterol/gamma-HCH transport system substrate-binding protein
MTTQNSHENTKRQWTVGLFTLAGLAMIAGITIYVNDRPYWWKSCQPVQINVEDATGLKPKSPVRTLGIDIGYLSSVFLADNKVSLGICITADVEVLPSTRAFLKADGILGDKFVELKPVRYVGTVRKPAVQPIQNPAPHPSTPGTGHLPIENTIEQISQVEISQLEHGPKKSHHILNWVGVLLDSFVTPAYAQGESRTNADKADGDTNGNREIPVGEGQKDIQQVMNKVNDLVTEVSGLATTLKQAINPEDLKRTMQQLNKTLENASKTLAPEGGLNQTAQRTLAKLEDSIEQLRDQITRVNRGEGSVGMLLNDPSYAEELKEAINNINRMLSKVGGIRFVVDIGAEQVTAVDGGRAWGRLLIWTRPDRYYRVGVSADPRGRRLLTTTTTTTTVNGVSQTATSNVETHDITDFVFNAMVGKIFFGRLDASIGVLHGDGALSLAGYLGPNRYENRIQLGLDVYSRPGGGGLDLRVTAHGIPWPNIYVRAGIEGFRQVNGQIPFLFGAGISFDDEDIRLLFALR